MLKALERHVPSAKALLSGAAALEREEPVWEEGQGDFLCSYGVSAALYEKARPWLDADPKRRLVFVEDCEGALAQLLQEDDAVLLLNDARVKLHFLQSPLQIEPIAKKIAWSAVFLKLEILDLAKSTYFSRFREALLAVHEAAHLLLSDAADWGCSAIRNAKTHLSRPYRSAMDLKDAFRNIPAIVVGAGPSLEKNGHLLKEFRDKALILAGGHALDRVPAAPHFGACIDKEMPLERMSFPDVPLCFQARTHPENFALAKGEALIAPDGHFPFLNRLAGLGPLFDGGWTVGNFLTALSVHWGCDPIVFVGMDYCYSGLRKYASGENATSDRLIEAQNRFGETVWTQRDWLMAIRWTNEFARNHPERTFIDATEGGMGFGSPISSKPLRELVWPKRPIDTRAAIEKAPLRLFSPRWEEWEESLRSEGEMVYEELLSPLWRIWRPVFERELEIDPQRLPLSEKIRLNERLFYDQVIQEHLDALR